MKYQEILIENKTVAMPEGGDMNLSYFLLISHSQENGFYYGIKIQKDWNGIRENALEAGISCSKEEVLQYIARLCRNTVTPFSFAEVFDDCIYSEAVS